MKTEYWPAYVSGVVLYGLAILIYSFFPYYREFIAPRTYQLILYLYLAYVVISFLWFFFLPWAKTNTRTIIFWRGVGKIVRAWISFFSRLTTSGLPDAAITKEEKATILFFLVKFFFTPIMINFLFGNIDALASSGSALWGGSQLSQAEQTRLVYFTILNAMLIVDTSYFVLGYLFEFASWGNELRSTEPTLLGWVVALACYPPFNGLVTQIIGWGSSEYGVFPSPAATLITVYASLVLFFIYTWATVALGLKASNLTNRGIVSHGPYAYVRHPAYVAKNLHWLIMGLPLIAANWFTLFSLAAWGGIYFLRALTEERHLLADPDYQAYCRKVPYRFIPGVI